MNGIIHNCTHPEDRPAPKNEYEMMVAIFEYIDRIFGIIRPTRLLYLAIDGVAPRAKMNQQRSRRFQASKESANKVQEIARITQNLKDRGADVPPQIKQFDQNCITPGTEFMKRLSTFLHYYVHFNLRNDPDFRTITVILSDANVPGEGEHKIMDYIRRQKAQLSHDPETHHVVCGSDADLIFLGLTTHERNFTIMREKFKYKRSPCGICGKLGHKTKDCQGAEQGGAGGHGATDTSYKPKFILVKLNVLRRHIEQELRMSNFPFTFDPKRAVDDWVFLYFFLGNYFLPPLFSLEKGKAAMDRLFQLYKTVVLQEKSWLTENGIVNLERLKLIFKELALVENGVLEKQYKKDRSSSGGGVKRRRGDKDGFNLWKDGFKDRYYMKFMDSSSSNPTFRSDVVGQYARGLSWILQTYNWRVPSWKWFYPYHYSPLACDLQEIASVNIHFENDSKPFSPLEQLMGVLPAASSSHLPPAWAKLMKEPESPIIDFYPEDFKTDLNGKKFASQGVALLPSVDEERLKIAVEPLFETLTEGEKRRNVRGVDLIFVGQNHPAYGFLSGLLKNSTQDDHTPIALDSKLINGISGHVFPSELCIEPGGSLDAPVKDLMKLDNCYVICMKYQGPIPVDSDFKSSGSGPNSPVAVKAIVKTEIRDDEGKFTAH